MIYDFPEPSSPIGQGDIYFGVPILDLTDDELPVVDDEGNAQTLPWETFASASESVSAIVAVRPTIAIVGTQECDALRAPNITLFEVRPFRDVERKSKDTSKPSKWVPLITQHARINQKWFYLPADERIGFTDKMGADFLTPIRIPRLALERLLSFRKGRLNEVAKQHFRERLAEFFRRYAYDEWYPLTREELAEYQKNHPDAEPFPWQRERVTPQNKERNEQVEGQAGGGEKHRSEYEADWNRAVDDVRRLLAQVASNIESFIEQLGQHIASLVEIDSDPERVEVDEFLLSVASGMDGLSERIEGLLPAFQTGIEALERSYSMYLLALSPESEEDVKKISRAREILPGLLSGIQGLKEALINARDTTINAKRGDWDEKTSAAIERQSKALDSFILSEEEFESFALKMIFIIDEKFGAPPLPEDEAG
jgi:hypothetical protein